MSAKRKPGSATRLASRRIFEERGDASTKVLHRTIVVCAVGLVAVLAFALTPRKSGTPASASVPRAEAKAPVASFDRTSLSTKKPLTCLGQVQPKDQRNRASPDIFSKGLRSNDYPIFDF